MTNYKDFSPYIVWIGLLKSIHLILNEIPCRDFKTSWYLRRYF